MPVKLSQISLFNFEEPEQEVKADATPPPAEAALETVPANEQLPQQEAPAMPETPVARVPEVIFTEPDKEPVDLTTGSFGVKQKRPVFNGSGFGTGSKAGPVVLNKSKRGRKSMEELTASVDLVNVPPDEILFQKRYYAIGKVAEMFHVNQSLLRLWENEFDILKPKKNGKGDRFFRPEDIKNIQLIHHLMREKKYTMEGAKNFIKNNKKVDQVFAMIESLKKIKGFLLELKANL